MARLLEHQGKGWLREAGLAVPRGRAAGTAEQATAIAAELARPVVVKAQVQAGGRGKAGGLLMADRPAEAGLAARSLLGSELKGAVVRQVLVEEKLDIVQEFYAGYTVNSSREARCPMLMFSPEGGMDIESVPEASLFQLLVSPTKGPDEEALLALLDKAGVAAERQGGPGRVPGRASFAPIEPTTASLWRSTRWSAPGPAISWPRTARWRSTTIPSSGTRKWA